MVRADFFQVNSKYTVIMNSGYSYEGKILKNDGKNIVLEDRKSGKVELKVEEIQSGAKI